MTDVCWYLENDNQFLSAITMGTRDLISYVLVLIALLYRVYRVLMNRCDHGTG